MPQVPYRAALGKHVQTRSVTRYIFLCRHRSFMLSTSSRSLLGSNSAGRETARIERRAVRCSQVFRDKPVVEISLVPRLLEITGPLGEYPGHPSRSGKRSTVNADTCAEVLCKKHQQTLVPLARKVYELWHIARIDSEHALSGRRRRQGHFRPSTHTLTLYTEAGVPGPTTYEGLGVMAKTDSRPVGELRIVAAVAQKAGERDAVGLSSPGVQVCCWTVRQ